MYGTRHSNTPEQQRPASLDVDSLHQIAWSITLVSNEPLSDRLTMAVAKERLPDSDKKRLWEYPYQSKDLSGEKKTATVGKSCKCYKSQFHALAGKVLIPKQPCGVEHDDLGRSGMLNAWFHRPAAPPPLTKKYNYLLTLAKGISPGEKPNPAPNTNVDMLFCTICICKMMCTYV